MSLWTLSLPLLTPMIAATAFGSEPQVTNPLDLLWTQNGAFDPFPPPSGYHPPPTLPCANIMALPIPERLIRWGSERTLGGYQAARLREAIRTQNFKDFHPLVNGDWGGQLGILEAKYPGSQRVLYEPEFFPFGPNGRYVWTPEANHRVMERLAKAGHIFIVPQGVDLTAHADFLRIKSNPNNDPRWWNKEGKFGPSMFSLEVLQALLDGYVPITAKDHTGKATTFLVPGSRAMVPSAYGTRLGISGFMPMGPPPSVAELVEAGYLEKDPFAQSFPQYMRMGAADFLQAFTEARGVQTREEGLAVDPFQAAHEARMDAYHDQAFKALKALDQWLSSNTHCVNPKNWRLRLPFR